MKTTLYTSRVLLLCLFTILSFTLTSSAEADESFYIQCPSDYWLDCNDELWDLSIYGNTYYHDYNGDHDAGAPVVTHSLNMCNVGTIYRTWTVYDYNGYAHSCTQHLYVASSGHFTEANIDWPEDTELEGCNPHTHPDYLPSGSGWPTWDWLPCSMVATNYDDMWFNFSSTCKKLVRVWTVIDWCQYTTGGNYGIWTYWQIIKVSESDPPIVECQEVVEVSSHNCYNEYVEVDPLYIHESSCGGNFGVTNNSPYADENGADISGTYPLGTTTVKYTIEYGCGYKSYCYTDVVVTDNKKPHVYCLAHIVTALMPVDNNNDGISEEGMVTIWAKDLDWGSSSQCGHDPLIFSFSEDVTHTYKTFTCAEIGNNAVNMWVTDSQGNQAYCTVDVEIQNNGANIPNCEPEPDYEEISSLHGRIGDQFDDDVEDAEVSVMFHEQDTVYTIHADTSIIMRVDSFINSSGYWVFHEIHDSSITVSVDTSIVLNEIMHHAMSDDNGQYIFEEMSMYREYMLFADKDEMTQDRINNSDVSTLFRHLTGQAVIENPYILIAADTDENGVINFEDLMNLLQFAQSKISGFPAENDWVVISRAYEFVDPLDPFSEDLPLEKYITLNDSLNVEDFVAIMRGDLINPSADQFAISNQPEIDMVRLEVALRNKEYENIESKVVNDITVYPNPVSDYVNFEIFSDNNQDGILTMTDALGRTIVQERISLSKGINRFQYNLATTQDGILLYDVVLKDRRNSGKVIVK